MFHFLCSIYVCAGTMFLIVGSPRRKIIQRLALVLNDKLQQNVGHIDTNCYRFLKHSIIRNSVKNKM
jgi:hypothetical protein